MSISNLKKLRQLSLATFTSIFLVGQIQAAPVQIDGIAAIVNDDIILESEFNQRIQMVRSQLAARQQRIPPDNILRSQIMDRLVLDNLMLQMADQQGIKITDRQLNDAIGNIASRNNMTVDQFRDALIAEGQDYANAREQIRKEMLVAQVQQSNVSRRIRISDQEIKNFLKSDAAKANQPELLLSTILIAIPDQASPEEIKEAEAKAAGAYKELKAGANFAEMAIAISSDPNALNGGDLGWRKTAELPEVLADALIKMKAGEITQPIRTPGGFYITQLREKRGGSVQLIQQTHVQHILLKPSEIRTAAQTKRLIDRLYAQINEGESFEALAKELSDDAASGSEGGELGWASPGQMVPEFEQVMDRTPNGALSEPFESRFGWHILKVIDRRTEDMSDKLLESQARATIGKRKFTEELNTWMREVRADAYVEIKE